MSASFQIFSLNTNPPTRLRNIKINLDPSDRNICIIDHNTGLPDGTDAVQALIENQTIGLQTNGDSFEFLSAPKPAGSSGFDYSFKVNLNGISLETSLNLIGNALFFIIGEIDERIGRGIRIPFVDGVNITYKEVNGNSFLNFQGHF